MKKTSNTSTNIVEYIQQHAQATPKELARSLDVSVQMVHRSLKKLVLDGVLEKKGSAPQVFYSVNQVMPQETKTERLVSLEDEERALIEHNFYHMSPDGRELIGVDAFIIWCHQRAYDVTQKAKEYVATYKRYHAGAIETEGLNATSKILSTFKKENRCLDTLIYLYPYSLPVFGKTKISEILFHAKQNQDERLMRKAFDMMKENMYRVIEHINPDAIGFIPPTLQRKKQIMKELQSYLHLNRPLIRIEKIKTPVIVQQKTLKSIEDRIINADRTMVVINTNRSPYKKVLLIDDFTGSGSTLNEIAKKIKHQHIAETVVGLTLTGSVNGFDVIREV